MTQKLSQVIQKLQEALAAEGDLDVVSPANSTVIGAIRDGVVVAIENRAVRGRGQSTDRIWFQGDDPARKGARVVKIG